MNLLGVYSFPKSGNTWISGIISYLFFGGDLDAVPSVYSKSPLKAPRTIINGESWSFYRSHSQKLWDHSLTDSDDPDEVSLHRAVYIVRHPLDVFLSSLNWLGNVERMPTYFIAGKVLDVEEIVARGHLKYYFGAFLCHMTLQPEFLDAGRWDYNAIEWHRLSQADDLIDFIKYEDLVRFPVDVLLPIFSPFGKTSDDIASALKYFDDRFPRDNAFFWSKTSGMHEKLIPPSMLSEFHEFYTRTLDQLGYEV